MNMAKRGNPHKNPFGSVVKNLALSGNLKHTLFYFRPYTERLGRKKKTGINSC